jgi:hypothetical protein
MSPIGSPRLAPRLGLALALIAGCSGCSLLGSNEEPVANLVVSLSLDLPTTRVDPAFALVCQGAVPLRLDIRGGRAPYDAVFTAAQIGGPGHLVTPYGPLGSTEIATLVQTFDGEGGFPVTHPALSFASPRPASTAVANVQFGVLVKDRDAKVTFRQVVLGQPLPPDLTEPGPDARLRKPLLESVLISSCSQ